MPGTDRPFEIAPSVLPVDFANFGQACVDLVEAGVDRIQFDIMDGRFVPNLTFGPDLVASVRSLVDVPFEAHLMVHEPDWIVPQFVDAGCGLIIVHAESVIHLHRSLSAVGDAGARAAVALNPATPIEDVLDVLDLVEMVLIMTVNPGFGGQSYIATMEPKIARLRRHIVEHGLDVDIEVDGGIGPATVAAAATAGANVLVAGSALFRDPAGLAHAVSDLRARAEATRS
ncbi:MAG: ribulose-phosphate 3-epimerase [Acidimicrobiales bacterium]